jgi:hypothetical protein
VVDGRDLIRGPIRTALHVSHLAGLVLH